MPFSQLETSIDGAQPVELYKFVRGPNFYLYTSADQPIEYGGLVYVPQPIKRTGIAISKEVGRSTLKLTTSRSLPVLEEYFAAPPRAVTTLTIFRHHRGDVDFVVVWKGRVASVEFASDVATIVCEPIWTAMKAPGLRRRFSVMCSHVLYSPACGVDRTAFMTQAKIVSVNNDTIVVDTVGGHPDGYFAGGLAEILLPDSSMVSVGIGNQVGTTLAIFPPSPLIVPGLTVKLYAGCDKTMATCQNKFGNLDNYGGFPFIPTKNPFSGSPVG